MRFLGKDDYEHFATVKPEYKDQLLLTLLADRFGGDPCAFYRFEDYLKAKGIPDEFSFW